MKEWTQHLSDRLYQRTGLPLLGWIGAAVAALSFVWLVILQLWK
jgi:hypothetical protein